MAKKKVKIVRRNNDNAYGLIKRFRHAEEFAFRPHKTYWTKFIIDRQERTFLGHRPGKWCTIIIFYLCFYTGVAILSAICWAVFLYTFLPTDAPTERQAQPGVSFAPFIKTAGIVYDVNSFEGIEKYTNELDRFLKKYGEGGDFGGAAGCSAVSDYGFAEGNPCIFLKVNRMYGFKTDPYRSAAQLPGSAPADLRAAITENEAAAQEGRIWVSCTSDLGTDPTFTYFPPARSMKISSVDVDSLTLKDGRFYDAEDFGRIVAVKISNAPKGSFFQIKCYFWAKNLVQDKEMLYSRNIGKGFLKFDMKITDEIVVRKKTT